MNLSNSRKVLFIIIALISGGCNWFVRQEDPFNFPASDSELPAVIDQIKYLDNLISENPDNDELMVRYMELIIENNYPDINKNAESYFQYGTATGKNLFYSAFLDYRSGKSQSALKKLNLLVSLYPERADHYALLYQIFMANKLYDSALYYINKAIQFDPYYADYPYHKGLIHMEKKDTAQGIDCFKQTLSIDPYHLNAARELLAIYLSAKDYDKSIVLLEIISLNNPDKEVLAQLAECYIQTYRYEEAVQIIYKIKNIDNLLFNFIYSKYYLIQQKFDSGIWYAARVVESDPRNVNALLLLGEAYDRKYRFPEAVWYYNEVLKLDSANLIAKAEIIKLNRKIAYLRKIQEEYDSRPVIEPLKPIRRDN